MTFKVGDRVRSIYNAETTGTVADHPSHEKPWSGYAWVNWDGVRPATRYDETKLERIAPPAIEQTAFKVGDHVEGLGATWSQCTDEWFRGVYHSEHSDGMHALITEAGSTYPNRVVQKASLRPASTPPVRETTAAGSAEPFAAMCGDCGKPVTEFNSCRRTQVDAHGFKRYIAGSFHIACPDDPAQPAAVDLCACGKPATRPDPHLPDGDVPMEFCADCYRKEEERLLVEETDRRNDARRDERLAALSASDNPLDRLAARRQRASRAEIESGRAKGEERRPARGVRNEFANGRVLDGHPPSWPEGDE